MDADGTLGRLRPPDLGRSQLDDRAPRPPRYSDHIGRGRRPGGSDASPVAT